MYRNVCTIERLLYDTQMLKDAHTRNRSPIVHMGSFLTPLPEVSVTRRSWAGQWQAYSSEFGIWLQNANRKDRNTCAHTHTQGASIKAGLAGESSVKGDRCLYGGCQMWATSQVNKEQK